MTCKDSHRLRRTISRSAVDSPQVRLLGLCGADCLSGDHHLVVDAAPATVFLTAICRLCRSWAWQTWIPTERSIPEILLERPYVRDLPGQTRSSTCGELALIEFESLSAPMRDAECGV